MSRLRYVDVEWIKVCGVLVESGMWRLSGLRCVEGEWTE